MCAGLSRTMDCSKKNKAHTVIHVIKNNAHKFA